VVWNLTGLTENDGHENDGPSKLQGMKLQDKKYSVKPRTKTLLQFALNHYQLKVPN